MSNTTMILRPTQNHDRLMYQTLVHKTLKTDDEGFMHQTLVHNKLTCLRPKQHYECFMHQALVHETIAKIIIHL